MSQQHDSDSVDGSVRTGVTVAAVALLVVAAVAAAWFGYAWIAGGLVRDNGRADARDTALNDARQAAVNLMTFDPDDVDGSLRTMLSSTTGSLRAEQTEDLDSLKAKVSEAQTRMRAEVEGAAITSLAGENDRATAFVVLRITRAWPGGQPATFRQLWNLDMVKEGDTWKAEQARNLGEPVSLDAGAPPTEPAPAEQPEPNGQPQSGDQPESAGQQPADQQPQEPGR
ncbi:hypothetical protein [Nocardia sp. CC227C]|uniref:hypothetical protein n=1 Tax=Nocardia sp. CC227C TaxID=3044562 RepID=UPI00278BF09C|nr:hypothetical protein [Nocardia sp. CC227C]